MAATLRVVLDQLVAPTDPDLAMVSGELTKALVAHAPAGCEVAGLVPAGPSDALAPVLGLARIDTLGLARRELAAAWQLGIASGAGGGLIHSPSLMAPLARHDRAQDFSQTVVTMWDLAAWDAPDALSRSSVAWQKAMLKRAVKYADAVVVPTHAMADRLGEIARLGERIRVIAGAAAEGFAVPTDEVGRRREIGIPDGFVLLSGQEAPSAGLAEGFAAIARAGVDLPVVVIDAPEPEETAILALATDAGIASDQVFVRPWLDDADRASVFAGAVVFVASSIRTAFPWRVIEALRLGVPVVAAGTPVHAEVIVDGGVLAEKTDADSLAAALALALGSASTAERLGVLAGDRGRAFSWAGAAERVWQLHADL